MLLNKIKIGYTYKKVQNKKVYLVQDLTQIRYANKWHDGVICSPESDLSIKLTYFKKEFEKNFLENE